MQRLNKYEKMWKILRKECVKNREKSAKWLFFLYLMNRIERDINVHEEAKTAAYEPGRTRQLDRLQNHARSGKGKTCLIMVTILYALTIGTKKTR